jgi:hypothetical protein
MNTHLLETSSTTREHERSSDSHDNTRRTSLVDRLAMRVGLALLVWSRRTARRLSAEQVTLQRGLTAQVRGEQESADTTRSLLGPR